MEQEDREELDVCSLCGSLLSLGPVRAFGFGTDNVLCGACATARGGRYNAERDVWEVTPDLSGLPDEAYGAAPHERRRGDRGA
jgi:hypothetical protein